MENMHSNVRDEKGRRKIGMLFQSPEVLLP